MVVKPLSRADLVPQTLEPARDYLDAGRALARDWQVGGNAFLRHYAVASEADFKRRMMAEGRIMLHAQIGFRDHAKTVRAAADIYSTLASRDTDKPVHRYGVCLDWSMAVPIDARDEATVGTGLILRDMSEYVAIAEAAPVAPHFGDFVLGFENAVATTQGALAAGATTIGNLGQYFTFRVPGRDDDAVVTGATLKALGLIAAQPVDILIHSNLDDGFAGLFTDMTSTLGAVLLEKYIVEELIGLRICHCYGHHYSDPLRRLAFHLALAEVSEWPGSMVYGNTTSYRGDSVENYASLAGYFAVDIWGQRLRPTGHALNPVPVTENQRIPDTEEIIDAQRFAARLIERTAVMDKLIDTSRAAELAKRLVIGGQRFCRNVLEGLSSAGVDVRDAGEVMIALRRIGGKGLEVRYGVGAAADEYLSGRRPMVPSPLIDEIEELARASVADVFDMQREKLCDGRLKVLTASTDVHEHGRMVLETALTYLGVWVVDGGVSVSAQALADAVVEHEPDAVAVSTYNGIALSFGQALKRALGERGLETPILLGGRINQLPEQSNTSLPVDVGDKLNAAGIYVCREIADAVEPLLSFAELKRVLRRGRGS